jgi:LemA protein
VVGIGTCTTYNRLVGRDQAVRSQWAQVENAHQRRADLVPNPGHGEGRREFERETLTAVTEARPGRPGRRRPTSPAAPRSSRTTSAQDQLGSALSRLLVVAEQYLT